MANIRYISHASVLIESNNQTILTDPWYDKPAFGSWLPTPPMSIHPVYILTLAKDNPNFSLAISHGHDDHIDDYFLSLFDKNTRVLIPEYSSKGFLFRIKNKGFTNIVEVPTSGYSFNTVTVKSYINTEISRDDGILTFEFHNHFVVHANDNWQEITGSNFEQMKSDADRFAPDRKLFMSQCNLADGWPNIYRDYSEEEKNDIHEKRVNNIIKNSLGNANSLRIRNFLNYAGHASAFVKNRPDLKSKVSFKSNEYIQDIVRKSKFDVNVLNMIPGDTFNFEGVRKLFQQNLDEEELKQQSFAFYEATNKLDECDSYKNYESLPYDEMKNLLDEFVKGFAEFVTPRIDRTQFNTDILGYKVVFSSTGNDTISSSVVVGDEFKDKTVHFYVLNSVLSALLRGEINWENLYIGYGAEIETTPKDTNARAVIRWMAMYGYVYQRNINAR